MIPKQNCPHALLVQSEPEACLPKLQEELRVLLCENNNGCNQCQSCQLFQSASGHPDLLFIEPEGKLNITKIEAVRKVINFLEQSALRGGMRIVVFKAADTLNIASQNALLKSLEEPGTKTLIILISHKVHLLLPTIKSRCQLIQVQQDLKTQDQMLIAALLNQSFNPSAFVESHKDLEPLDCVYAQMQIIYHQMQQTPHLALAQFYKDLTKKSALLQKKIALNTELMLFELALAWQRFFTHNNQQKN